MKRMLLLAVALFAGLSLLSREASAVPRKVLAELFTSTTCAPCYNPDYFYFYQWLPNYGGAEQIVTLAYHVWWPSPGNDPMYLANTIPVQARVNYYMPPTLYVPRMYIDGFVDGGSGYTSWPGAIEARFLDASPISITLTGTRNGNTLNMNARIYAEGAVSSANWRVHWVVVESEISEPQNSGSGYVPFVHHVAHRNMYPDANGSAITISQGQTVDIPRTITLNTGWVANHCKVIVFVQNNTDKKVQNAEVINVDMLTDVSPGGGEIPAAFSLSQNYPNPFNPTTTISFALSEESYVSLKVFNLLGEEVRTLVAETRAAGNYEVTWDGKTNSGKDATSGVYLYQMIAGKFRETRKMTLTR
jgi:hypothetical protein